MSYHRYETRSPGQVWKVAQLQFLAAYQKWHVKESEIGRTSSSKGQISLLATTSIRQFRPCWSLYLYHVKATLAPVPNAAVLIQLSLPVIFEKSSHSLESGPWMALSERPNFWGIPQLPRHDTKEVPWLYGDDWARGHDCP